MTEGWMKRDLGDYVFIFINELLKSTEEVIFFLVAFPDVQIHISSNLKEEEQTCWGHLESTAACWDTLLFFCLRDRYVDSTFTEIVSSKITSNQKDMVKL